MVFYVLIFQIKVEIARFALFCWFDLNFAACVQWARCSICKILLFRFGQEGYIFVTAQNLIFDLRLDKIFGELVGYATEVDVVEYVNFEVVNISDWKLNEDGFVVLFVDEELEVYEFVALVVRFSDAKG